MCGEERSTDIGPKTKDQRPLSREERSTDIGPKTKDQRPLSREERSTDIGPKTKDQRPLSREERSTVERIPNSRSESSARNLSDHWRINK